jgi:DNA helicase-2/ATP-dependent DNA helicase PcrA
LQPILDHLNPAQIRVVTMGDGPILVIAGAGSGKTRTLVHRLAWLVEQGMRPENILLLTFTRRAAEEMLNRARLLQNHSRQVMGGTFHSLCHRLLRESGHLLNLPSHFTVLDRADGEQMLRSIVSEHNLKTKGDSRFPKAGTVLDLISKARNLEIGLGRAVEEYVSHLLLYLPEIEKTAALYARQKQDFALLDYDDLLYFTETLLIENHELRQRLGQRFRSLLIDEYQDTNAVQARLVDLLACGHRNVMAVGDDAQSIYRFRGARIENILEFSRIFSGARTVKLEENYRSTKSILDLTNHIISSSRQVFAKKLLSNKPDGPKPALLRPRTEKEQSALVVENIDRLRAGGASLSQIAVLFRSSHDSYQLEVELGNRQLPFVKVGGFRFLESQHNKDVLAHLRVVANPHDLVSWQRLLTLLPGVGLKRGQAIVTKIAAEPDQAAAVLAQEKSGPPMKELVSLLRALQDKNITPLQAARLTVEYYEPLCRDKFEDYPRRLRDLAEIISLAESYDDLGRFMTEVVLEPPAQRASGPEEERLTLTTMHSAKGLEWEHVFIIWASQGRFPSLPSLLDADAFEEERRLMYVACTRAAASLTVIAPSQHYSPGQGAVNMPLSVFLEDVPTSLLNRPSASVFKLPAWAVKTASGSDDKIAPARRKTAHPSSEPRPFAVGSSVRHHSFGQGRVMGYKGEDKILVNFERVGLKILIIQYARLEAV